MTATNPRGYSTSYTYTACPGKYAFVTTIAKPAAGHTASFAYDCNLGQLISSTDPGGFSTRAEYGNSGQDVMDRISKLIRPNGQQTVYTYSADLTTVTTKADQYAPGDQGLMSSAIHDGLGRTVETRIYT